MVLAIDIGNTRVKAAVFEDDTLREQFSFDSANVREGLLEVIENFRIREVVVSSVKYGMLDFLPETVQVHTISRDKSFPFINCYGTPGTLGIDRMVLASGATMAFEGAARLVIDAGTCVTYDFVDSENRYQGGAISPGLRLRYRVMNEYTAGLPLLDTKWPDDVIGKSTAESMHNGAAQGLAFEIDGFIDRYRENNPNFITILTGGDANFLAAHVKNTIFASPNFLLESLYRTFQYQSRHD